MTGTMTAAVWFALLCGVGTCAVPGFLQLGGAYRTFIVSATPIVEGDEVKWLGACADIEPLLMIRPPRGSCAFMSLRCIACACFIIWFMLLTAGLAAVAVRVAQRVPASRRPPQNIVTR